MSSVNGSVDFDDWLDIGESSNLLTLKLDDVLNDVELLDDNLSFLDESENCSTFGPEQASSLSPTLYRYQLISAISCLRQDSISHQLLSLHEKAGSSQAIAEHMGKIAVGTKKGMILIFNEQNILERFVKGDDSSGSVSCLAFSPDKRDIAVGYSKGGIKVINVKTGTVKFSTSDAAQIGHGILQIVYIGNNNSFLTLDSGGNVFEVRLSSSLVRRKQPQSRCVFSGCNGEVLYMKYLSHSLLALLTVSKLMLVSTKFGGSVLCSFPLDFESKHPPLIDYCSKTDKRSSKELKLCVCRGTEIFIITVFPSLLASRRKASVLNAKFTVPTPVVGLQWFSPYAILTVDANGKTSVLDSVKGTVLKAQSNSLDLIFSTADYKGLATGGNVSAALRSLAEFVCYQTMCRSNEAVYIIASDGLYTIKALNEEDQVELFYEKGDFASACLYLHDLMIKRTQVTVSYRESLRNSLKHGLHLLTGHIMDGCKSGKVSELMAHYKKNIQVLLYTSIGAKMCDVLFDYSWSRIEKDHLAKTVLLELLDEWVLDQALYEAPPAIISAYLTHLSTEGHFAQFQSAVVRFPIHTIDINHVMVVCRQNGLYDGIIYVFNKALGDYITPLEEMLDAVASFVYRDVFTDSEVEQGNRLLMYVHCCLAGHAYPLGALPDDAKKRVPLEIYRCIVSLRGKDGRLSDDKYPYLRVLMLFDAQQFVNGICNSVDAFIFQEEDRLQRIAETLGLLSCELRTHTILVHYLQLIIQLVEKNLILPPVEIIENVINCLLQSSWQDSFAETTVVDVLKIVPTIDRGNVLRLAQTPLRPIICSFLYSNERQFIDLIKCCLVQGNNSEIFPVITGILHSDLTSKEAEDVESYVYELLPKLMKSDTRQCSQMILNFYPTYLNQLDLSTKESRQKHVVLVKNIMIIRRERQEAVISGNEDLDELLMGSVIEDAFISLSESAEIDQYLEDLIQYWQPIGTRTDFCLNIVSENNSLKAMILLLEARRLIVRAFDLLYGKLSELSKGKELANWLEQTMKFCNRNPIETEAHSWLLKIFKTIILKMSGSEMDSQLEQLCMRILSAGTVDAHELFTSLVDHSNISTSSYQEYHSLLNFILKACSFETSMLNEILLCMNFEMSQSLMELLHKPSTRVSQATLSICAICSLPISKSAFVFGCGHIIHMDCDQGKRECPCKGEFRYFGQKKIHSEKDYAKFVRCTENKIKKNIFINWDQQLQLTPH